MSDDTTDDGISLVEMTTEIVAAYVANNALTAADLPKLIMEVHAAFAKLSAAVASPAVEAQKPAVSIRKSLTPDYLICLEDGKKFKTLKRHLSNHYNMTPLQYREKWGLPSDYPLVAPNYTASRSAIAKGFGFGRKPPVLTPAAERGSSVSASATTRRLVSSGR